LQRTGGEMNLPNGEEITSSQNLTSLVAGGSDFYREVRGVDKDPLSNRGASQFLYVGVLVQRRRPSQKKKSFQKRRRPTEKVG